MSTWSIGTFPHTHTGKSGGHVHPLLISEKTWETMRSSSEWYEMTQMRPPGFAQRTAAVSPSSSASSSWLTSMRSAWNVLLAGCPPRRLAAAGMAPRGYDSGCDARSMALISIHA